MQPLPSPAGSLSQPDVTGAKSRVPAVVQADLGNDSVAASSVAPNLSGHGAFRGMPRAGHKGPSPDRPGLAAAVGLGGTAWPLVALTGLLLAVVALTSGWLLGLSQGLARAVAGGVTLMPGHGPVVVSIASSGPWSGAAGWPLGLVTRSGMMFGVIAGVSAGVAGMAGMAMWHRRCARRVAVEQRAAMTRLQGHHTVTVERLSVVQRELARAQLALAQSESAHRARSQLLAAASHDLRQPLHAMILLTEALRSRRHAGDDARLVTDLCAALSSLDELLGTTLDIASIDAGGVRVQPCDFTVEALWQRLRAQLAPEAFDKGLSLRSRGGQHVVHADPLLVERIVRNLVCNAIRCTEDGGVLMVARRRGHEVVLQVWDSGCGIAPADQQRVFDEFVQLQPAAGASPGQHRGLGLGLAIVRRLAGLMQCRLSLRSQPGRGTVFSLHLPLAGVVQPSSARLRDPTVVTTTATA